MSAPDSSMSTCDPATGLSAREASVPVGPNLEVLEGVFASLPLAVVVFDEALRVVHRNRAAQVLLADATNLAAALSRGSRERSEKEWAVALRQVVSERRPQQFSPVEYHLAAEAPRLLALTCAPISLTTPSSGALGYLLAEDITVSRSMQKRLAVSERYAAVGRLAARVAHELNNPLDGILRYINLAIRMIKPLAQDKPIHYLEESRKGLMRMARIISDLLEYSRSPQTELEEGNINAIIEDAVRAMDDKIQAHHVVVVHSFGQDMPRVPGASLFQVCCNLIKNAVDAMPDGGRLIITTQCVGNEAVLMFEDTGVGLPDEIQRVFEPFFTTKPPGEGTGLGLAICRDFITDKYRGTITAKNRAEGGAQFVIRIPAEADPSKPLDAVSGTSNAPA